MATKKWLGNKKCDICKTEQSTAWYDARTIFAGRWAFMCQTCWEGNRLYNDLGVGKGQCYDGETLEKIGG